MTIGNALQEVTSSNSSQLSGRRLIRAEFCQYPPAIEPADLVMVRFDQKRVQWPGLYLFEEIQDGRVRWMGCRRFDVTPSGVKVDATGHGDWQLFAGHAAATWRIAGYVEEVYKPSRTARG